MSAFIQTLVVNVLLLLDKGVLSWPAGQYGLPMSQTGCPTAQGFMWQIGRRTHHTEMGSHGSDGIHLAGVYDHNDNQITQSFCMKVDPIQSGDYVWGPGQYCIYKKNQCPEGFNIGWVYWDDAAPFFQNTHQNIYGEVPDGEYDRNTKINFCCRSDGFPTRALTLPTESPFHLFKSGDQCQMVNGMAVQEEFVYWKDESLVNLNALGGMYPKVLRSKYPTRYTKVFYCYYSPKEAKASFGKVLLALYVIAGTIGLIIVLLPLLWICQRLCTRRPKECEESNAVRGRVLGQSGGPTEPVVVYHANPSAANGGPASASGAARGAVGGATAAPIVKNKGRCTTVQLPEKKQPLGAPEVVLSSSGSEDSALSGHLGPPDEATPMLSSDSNYMAGEHPQPPSYEDVLREDGLA